MRLRLGAPMAAYLPTRLCLSLLEGAPSWFDLVTIFMRSIGGGSEGDLSLEDGEVGAVGKAHEAAQQMIGVDPVTQKDVYTYLGGLQTVERVHSKYAMHCPIYRTLHKAIQLTSSFELVTTKSA
jgi:hypothetical protein